MGTKAKFALITMVLLALPFFANAQTLGIIQGYKVKMPEMSYTQTPPSVEMISVDGVAATSSQPYFLNVPSGTHSVSVTVPLGWTAGYTLCYNDTSCHATTPTLGNTVTVNVPSGGFADLWWHFTPPVASSGTIQGLKVDWQEYPFSSPGATITINGQNFDASVNPYSATLPAGTYTVQSSIPTGYTVSYSTCVNCIDHTVASYVAGNVASITIPPGGYVDLHWKYQQPPTTIQGYKVDADGLPLNSLATGVLLYYGSFGGVMISNQSAVPIVTNPYTTDLPAGTYTAIATIPEGYSVQYSKCINCTNHPASSFVNGNGLDFIAPPGGFVDLWWKYIPTSLQSTVKKIVEAGLGGYSYAYAPTIINKSGTYHMFFCSYAGSLSPNSTDAIRYVTSTDGIHWSSASVALLATGFNGQDLNACDPDVVLFNGFYYMYYTDTLNEPAGNPRGVIQVARSSTINGPYLTLTKRGTWEKTPNDPQVIIYPLARTSSGYGAGEQQVVVHNGKLYMWYNDDSLGQGLLTYMIESTDPIHWTSDASQVTDIPGGAHSPDVKFDPVRNTFVMVRILNPHTVASSLVYGISPDGLHWSSFTTLLSTDAFPHFANNDGIAADESGTLLPGTTLVAFAAPYQRDRSIDTWGFWDLYGFFADLSPSTQVCIPNWSCTDWNQCSRDSTQSRTCTDINACGVTTGKPVEKQSCIFWDVGAGGGSGNAGSDSTAILPVNSTAVAVLQTVKKTSVVASPVNPGTVASPPTTKKSTVDCPIIIHRLARGTRGEDVRSLQQYFVSEGLFSSDSATGYFGFLTQVAVQKWQASHGIVSSGTPAKTGWGVIGPKTRIALVQCNK